MIANNKKIRLYTDWDLKPSIYSMPSFLLYPLFKLSFPKGFDFMDKSEFRDTKRFESIDKNWDKYFNYVSQPIDAEWAILPSDWKYYKREGVQEKGLNFIEQMTKLNKKVLIQYNSDDDLPILGLVNNQNIYVVRTSFNNSKCKINEYVMPGFVGDPLPIYSNNRLSIRKKNEKPKVVFCGWANEKGMTSEELRNFSYLIDNNFSEQNIEEQKEYIYLFRGTVLNLLSQNNRIETNLIAREGYCAGIDKENDEASLKKVRHEYYSNLLSGDYVICIRGKGNYSYRFYETLAMGRIPILVDTDCPLPFNNLVKWEDHCLIIDHHSTKNIADIIIDFHEALSSSRFEEMQKSNRKIWEDMFIPEKFFAHFFYNVNE